MDVTTVNLRDFSTNTMLDRSGGGIMTQTRGTTATVDFAPPELTLNSSGLEGSEKQQQQPQQQKQQRSIVWLTPDTFQRSESTDGSDDKNAM